MNKSLIGVIAALIIAVTVVFLWEVKVNDFSTKNYEPKYTQCENVYVRKSPHPCNAGDLIYIDADVAERYCTSNIIARFDNSVYCQYNGFRDDLAEITSTD